MTTLLQVVGAIVWANLVEWIGHRRLHDTHDPMHVRHHDHPWPVGGLLIGHPLLLLTIAAHVGFAAWRGWHVAWVTWLIYVGVLEVWHWQAHKHPTHRLAEQHISHHRVGEGNWNVFLPLWDWLLGTRIHV